MIGLPTPPKITYRKNRPKFNKDNIFGVETLKEAEEIHNHNLDDCRRAKTKKEKLLKFESTFYLGIGNFVSREYVFAALDYVGLSIQDINSWLLGWFYANEQGFKMKYKYEWKWFRRLFQGGLDGC